MQSTGTSTPQNNPPIPQPQEAAADCSICLTSYEGMIVKITECNHIFHKNCLDTWLKYNPTCPMCRTALDERDVFELNLDPRPMVRDFVEFMAISTQPSSPRRRGFTAVVDTPPSRE